MRNWAVDYNVATFSLPVHLRERPSIVEGCLLRGVC